MEFISSQTRFLLWAAGCGAMLGVTYWMLMLFRRAVKHHGIAVAFEDILYWAMAVLLMFAVILVANDGAVRLFSIIGMLLSLGGSMYLMNYVEKVILVIAVRIRLKISAGKKVHSAEKKKGTE